VPTNAYRVPWIRLSMASLLASASLVLAAACSDEPTVGCTASDAEVGCKCSSDESAEANDARCEPEGGGAICCASEAWPEDSTFCECSGRWRCQASNGSSTCACQLGALVYDGVPEVDTCAAAEGAVCCQFWDTCNCGSGACEEGHTQVASCDFAAVVDLLTTYRCGTQLGAAGVDSCVVAR
jgi:hypothetical protein